MGWRLVQSGAVAACLGAGAAWAQAASSAPAQLPGQGPQAASTAPLPDPQRLLLEVERNEEKSEALRRDYTYHVHLEQQELDKHGIPKKQETTDSQSFTLDGVRVDRVIARNGQPLSPAAAAKENARLDKVVAEGKKRRAKAAEEGQSTDDQGHPVLSASRILELGRFSHERRIDLGGRPTLVLDYAGDPDAKTHTQAEEMVRDLVGTVWIDEADRVLVRGEGHFLKDLKIGGGLLADVKQGTHFTFTSTHVGEGVWLPATVSGAGSLRVLLFFGFNGRIQLQTSDYQRFRTSATVLPGQRRVQADVNASPQSAPAPATPRAAQPADQPHP